MKRHAGQQDEAGRPDNFQVGLQEIAVFIELIGADEDLQIAGQMPDDEKHHHAASGGHDILLPQRGAEQVA